MEPLRTSEGSEVLDAANGAPNLRLVRTSSAVVPDPSIHHGLHWVALGSRSFAGRQR